MASDSSWLRDPGAILKEKYDEADAFGAWVRLVELAMMPLLDPDTDGAPND